MSAFTDRLYESWRLSFQPAVFPARTVPASGDVVRCRWLADALAVGALWKTRSGVKGGMGAVAPMATTRRLPNPVGRGQLHRPGEVAAARLDQQKKTPASATNTPGAVTNIQGPNVDRTHCRP